MMEARGEHGWPGLPGVNREPLSAGCKNNHTVGHFRPILSIWTRVNHDHGCTEVCLGALQPV